MARPVARTERQAAFRTGISAESRAAAYLIAKGFRILARRWKSPVGEIDIVARRRRLLVFVEAKARGNLDEAAESLQVLQQRRIAAARRRGWRPIPTRALGTFASTPCWSRPASCRATSRRRSKQAEWFWG